MAARNQIDLTKWNAMCRDLSRLTGKSQAHIVKYEAAKTLESAANLTTRATKTSVTASVEKARPATILKLAHKAGYVHFTFTQKKAHVLKLKLKAAGLAKQTWWRLARSFGFDIKTPGYVKKAVPSTGRTYAGTEKSREAASGARYVLTVETSQPTITAIGGAFFLNRAIKSRVSYFTRNLKNKVFESAANIAKRYPGIKTTV